MGRNLFTIILGLQSYSGDPEEETDWARCYFVLGIFVGVVAAVFGSTAVAAFLHR